MKIALIGFGVVGQGLVEILRDKAEYLRETAGFTAQIVAVTTGSRGSLYHPDGLDVDALLLAGEQGHLDYYPDAPGLHWDWDSDTTIRECNADVVVLAIPTNLDTGHPALEYSYSALDTGKHLVLANKGPVALAYNDLCARALQADRLIRFEATVMAGTPAIRVGMQALAGCTIREVRGIMNGTTNYILTQMEGGMAYAEALAKAQELGYAEADPSSDVEGWDAASKVMILAAALFDKNLGFDDLDVKGITEITPEDIKAASATGERWKLIARATPEGGSVQPVRVPVSDPLAGVVGATNAITYVTDLMGDITLVGAGAGRKETGFALLSDLLDIHRLKV